MNKGVFEYPIIENIKTNVVQGSNEEKAKQIAEEFKVEHEKSQEDNARNFAIFLSNRKDIKVLNIKVVGKAWQVEAKIEDDETK